ncbi:MAG TPA: hypothetical protein PLD47_02765 [Aggregatilineales bacterium]|nr:hypothetical protein [Aggregatilineales bacterium]
MACLESVFCVYSNVSDYNTGMGGMVQAGRKPIGKPLKSRTPQGVWGVPTLDVPAKARHNFSIPPRHSLRKVATLPPHILLIFLDGIGLGADDPTINPFAAADTPTLNALAGGNKWLAATGRVVSERAVFIPTDPRLGVSGRPQSATGQTAIITGRNAPTELGEHYGPYPNPAVRAIIDESSLFKRLAAHGKRGAYLAAYPPTLHAAIERGKRLRTALQHAAHTAGVRIGTVDDLNAGRAMSADFTGQGWRTFCSTPIHLS